MTYFVSSHVIGRAVLRVDYVNRELKFLAETCSQILQNLLRFLRIKICTPLEFHRHLVGFKYRDGERTVFSHRYLALPNIRIKLTRLRQALHFVSQNLV